MSALRCAALSSSSRSGHESGVGDDGEAQLERATRIFLAERLRLLRIAQRVVSDRAAAEDVVQDVWLRWQRVDQREIQNPVAFLTTATTHLAINVIQSARHRHEQPTESLWGAWPCRVPEPAGDAERAVAVDRMLGYLMAKLTSAELAAFVLRKSFDYPYAELAQVLETTQENARQLVRRAQVALATDRARPVDRVTHRRLVAAFGAATAGELGGLERVLVDAVSRCPRRSEPARRRRRAPREAALPQAVARTAVRVAQP
jgi:RNA polymerase sigma-70 factor (ECF subfamily)